MNILRLTGRSRSALEASSEGPRTEDTGRMQPRMALRKLSRAAAVAWISLACLSIAIWYLWQTRALHPSFWCVAVPLVGLLGGTLFVVFLGVRAMTKPDLRSRAAALLTV